MAEHRQFAAMTQERPVSRIGAAVIVLIWIAAAALCVWLVYHYFAGR